MSGGGSGSRGPLVWAVGIEDTFIGQPNRHSGHTLDEYELTQHYRFWREDLDRAASLGATAIRYGIPWYRVNPHRGRFDWAWTDEVLEYAVTRTGLAVIADLVHYGVPGWIPEAFADPAYPDAVGMYAGAFAERYRGLVSSYTPLNEPTITAQFCGQRGLWPPYRTGDDGWVAVVLGVVEGIRASIAAIRAQDPNAVIVHVEASKVVVSDDKSLHELVRRVDDRNYLPTDLLLGRVGPQHVLARWLVEHGATTTRLEQLEGDPPRIDLMGVNYYPEISARHLVWHRGIASEVAVDMWTDGLKLAVKGFATRYGLPVLVSETSTDGDDARRLNWLEASIATVERLRLEGVDIRAYTWWPLFDFIDWSHALGSERLEEFLVRLPDGAGGWQLGQPAQPSDAGDGAGLAAFVRRMGLWNLVFDPEGTLQRVESPAARRYQELIGYASVADALTIMGEKLQSLD